MQDKKFVSYTKKLEIASKSQHDIHITNTENGSAMQVWHTITQNFNQKKRYK